MNKDAHQKTKVIRYCVANGLVPFLEVAVLYEGDTGPAPSEITDVDVLGIRPADSAPLRRISFDCKTQRMSPINRALWAKGLADFIAAQETFVILTRPAPESHRLASDAIGVRLFSETIFDTYAFASSPDYGVSNSYIEKPEAWSTLSTVGSKYPAMNGHMRHLRSVGPLITGPTQALRSLVASTRKIDGELDPTKPEHRAVFLLTCMQLLLVCSELVRVFHNIFDPTLRKEEFEQTLRYYIWGGRENYEIRQRLKDAVSKERGEPPAFDLPGWSTFLEVFRALLDAPTLVGSCCLPLQDLAFRELVYPQNDLDDRLRTRLQRNNRIKQFIALAANCVLAASRLPREFRSTTNQALSGVSE
jgi:hypothetical protein